MAVPRPRPLPLPAACPRRHIRAAIRAGRRSPRPFRGLRSDVPPRPFTRGADLRGGGPPLPLPSAPFVCGDTPPRPSARGADPAAVPRPPQRRPPRGALISVAVPRPRPLLLPAARPRRHTRAAVREGRRSPRPWPDAPSPPSPEDFVECRRSRPHPSARWTADGAPSSWRSAPRRHACADDLCASAAFGARPPARTAHPEPRDGFTSLGRHAHAHRRAQRPSGRARCRCRATATRAVRRRFASPRASWQRRPARRPPPLRLRAPARPSLPSADASSGRQGGPRWREGWRHCVILAVVFVFCLGFATNRHV